MTVWLEIQRTSGTIEKRAIDPLGHVGIALGVCPSCGAEPFCVLGEGEHIHDRETLRANGRCKACNDPVGYIFARVNTLFGLEEDMAVINGRARVYG